MNAPSRPTIDPLTAYLAGVETRWIEALRGSAPAAGPAAERGVVLDRLSRALALEPAQADLVEFLFAAEYHDAVARLAQADGGGAGVPFALARSLIPGLEPASLAVASVLRRFEIVSVDGAPRALARLRLSEAMFDRLCGVTALDPAVEPAVRRMARDAELVEGLRAALATRGADGLSPLVALSGRHPEAAAAGLAALGLSAYQLVAAALPDSAETRCRWARLWARDAALDGAVLVVPATNEPHLIAALADVLDPLLGHAVIAGDMPLQGFARPVVTLAAGGTRADAAARWRKALGAEASERIAPALAGAAARFVLDDPSLARMAAGLGPPLAAEPDAAAAGRLLWRAAARAAPTITVAGVLHVEPQVGWQDIVLPPPLLRRLQRIESHVRHAHRVLDDWGFAQRMGGRGLGVAALFSGPSGTGKTMAAEVLAAALDLRMMLIDISQVTSKYIGETSKNVAAAFAEAERTGAVMVWNEGDAIWGARGSVGSATDRHVNAEVGDLLQRIEAFNGFTIVTTNMKGAIDPAFLRRFRFIAEFPLPAEAERERIWRGAFPSAAPLAVAETDWRTLAGISLTGAAIRNAALGAAFAAAEIGRPITLPLLAEEIAVELRKTGQPMPVLTPAQPVAA